MKYVVYDIETLRNLFTACFLDFETKKKREFVIFDSKDQLKDFVKFLNKIQKHEYTLVGFNCLAFDGQILAHILSEYSYWMDCDFITVTDIIDSIYSKAQEIIALQAAERFPNLIPEWKLPIPHIDLFKQKHYDGMAKKGTSLKWIQFSMRFPNVEEMPISHDQLVTKEQIPMVLAYNWNDVESTEEFFNRIKFETDLRIQLSEKYNQKLLNASEPRIAKSIFGKFLCEDMGIDMKTLRDMRTYRKVIKLSDVVFPYISFKDKQLQDIFESVKKVKINVGEGDKFKYSFNYGGINTDIGLGGIHACCSPGVYESSDELIIEDIDVVSFYPNLGIVNDIRPQHLGGSFSKIYKNFFDERQKIPKKDPVNYVYKIILNSTYGLSKEINSYLYDPFFTYSITINGQLSLLMLVESLVQQVPNIKIYQENTDGVTIGYNPAYRDLVSTICKDWCELTKLQLEHAFYKKMIIRDVNNYIAIKDGFNWDEYQNLVKQGKRKDYGYIKHKGTFELDLDYHKNPSFQIIPLATEAYFLGGVDYREFIKNHDDIYDFLAAVKRKSNFDLNLYKSVDGEMVKEAQQKVTRFYISTQGGMLIKDFNDKRKVARTSVIAGWKVQPLNKVISTSTKDYPDLNYAYYFKETEKMIASVEADKQQLELKF